MCFNGALVLSCSWRRWVWACNPGIAFLTSRESAVATCDLVQPAPAGIPRYLMIVITLCFQTVVVAVAPYRTAVINAGLRLPLGWSARLSSLTRRLVDGYDHSQKHGPTVLGSYSDWLLLRLSLDCECSLAEAAEVVGPVWLWRKARPWWQTVAVC